MHQEALHGLLAMELMKLQRIKMMKIYFDDKKEKKSFNKLKENSMVINFNSVGFYINKSVNYERLEGASY